MITLYIKQDKNKIKYDSLNASDFYIFFISIFKEIESIANLNFAYKSLLLDFKSIAVEFYNYHCKYAVVIVYVANKYKILSLAY